MFGIKVPFRRGAMLSTKVPGKFEDCGSPVWTRFELLRPETRSTRTTPIASSAMTYVRNGQARPDWAPSPDKTGTRRSASRQYQPTGWPALLCKRFPVVVWETIMGWTEHDPPVNAPPVNRLRRRTRRDVSPVLVAHRGFAAGVSREHQRRKRSSN